MFDHVFDITRVGAGVQSMVSALCTSKDCESAEYQHGFVLPHVTLALCGGQLSPNKPPKSRGGPLPPPGLPGKLRVECVGLWHIKDV